MRTLLTALLLSILPLSTAAFGESGLPPDLTAAEAVVYDAPSIDAAPDGAVWAAWVEYGDDGDDDVLAAAYRDGVWSEPTRVGDNIGADWQPGVACSPTGDVWVIWSNARWGDFGIRSRCLSGGEWSLEGMVTRKRGSFDYAPSVDVTPDGVPWVAWESTRDGDTNIYAAYRAKGRWSPPARVSPSPASDARPSVACTCDGDVWVAWDTVVDGEYRVVASQRAGRGWTEPVLLSPAGVHARRPRMFAGVEVNAAVVWEGLRSAKVPAGRSPADPGEMLALMPMVECLRVNKNGEWQGIMGNAAAETETPVDGSAPGAAMSDMATLYCDYVEKGARGCARLLAVAGRDPAEVGMPAAPRAWPGLALDEERRLWVAWITSDRKPSLRLRQVQLPADSVTVAPAPSPAAAATAAHKKERTVVRDGMRRYTLLWGDVNAGGGAEGSSASDALRWGRDIYGLDFALAAQGTDARDDYDWNLAKRGALIHNAEEGFAAMPGCSWAREGVGALAVVYGWHDEDLPYVAAPRPARGGPWAPIAARMDKLHKALVVASPESDWARLSNEGCPCAALSLGGETPEEISAIVEKALGRGLRLGFVGAEGGLTAAYSQRLTRASIADALARRRCYATNRLRVSLDARVDGRMMGEAWTSKENEHRFEIAAGSDSPITRVEVWGREGLLYENAPGVSRAVLDFTIAAGDATAEQYYFVRAEDRAGGVALSSPVFIWPEGSPQARPEPPPPPLPPAAPSAVSPAIPPVPSAPAGVTSTEYATSETAPAPPAPPGATSTESATSEPGTAASSDEPSPAADYTDSDSERKGFSLQKWLDKHTREKKVEE